MKKRVFRQLLCVAMLFAAVVLTACAGETETLQARIDSLEAENAELQSTISSLSAELENTQMALLSAQNELHLSYLREAEQENDEQGESAVQETSDAQVGPLAITYGGVANEDMSWPLDFGELLLGLRVDFSELGEENEIVWRSTNEDIFTVTSTENGTSATVTPRAVGAAQLVVTVGDRETRSWVRIS